MDQGQAPYFEALLEYVEQKNTRFHIPGHQAGLAFPEEMAALLKDWGASADITEVLGIDDIHAPHKQVLEAQELAAEAYGADRTYFLVNGSTVGNQAMFLSQLGPDDTVLMPESSHRSAYAALLLSGAKASCFATGFQPELLCCLPPTIQEVERAFSVCPQAKALFLTSPTYHGAGADMVDLAEWAKNRDVLLLVDEAWGGHLAFSPQLPETAVGKADLVVQSTHKMTSGLTQTAMLHVSGARVDHRRLELVLRHLQTSSPSSFLVGSIDCARRQMALEGKELWAGVLKLADETRGAIERLPGVACFAPPRGWDRSRLLITGVERGYTGHQLSAYLRGECCIQVEMSETHQVLVLLTPGHSREHTKELVQALEALPRRKATLDFEKSRRIWRSLHAKAEGLKPRLLDVRRAFQARSTRVQLKKAVDRTSAELLYFYPPGVPFVVPGQCFTQEILEHMITQQQLGGSLQGGTDPTLETVLVLKDDDE